MMDMTPIAQAILVYLVIGVGVLVTLATGFAQLRELPAAFKAGPNADLVRRGFLAASVGMGSVGGSILAIELGGPGAIGWMWVASLLGMGVIYAEVLISARLRRRRPAEEHGPKHEAATIYAYADALPASYGKPLAYLVGLTTLVFALAAGSLLQTQQSADLLATVGGDRWLVVGFLVAAAAFGMFVPKLRTFIVALGPVAVLLYVIAAGWVTLRAPGEAGAALASLFSGFAADPDKLAAGAAGGGVLMAMQAGFLRATLATEAGLGSSGFTPQLDSAKDPRKAAASAMLAPLISGIVVPTITALAVLTATPWVGERIDEPAERRPAADGRSASEAELVELAAALSSGSLEALSEADRQRVVATWAPLERPQARGSAASLEAGQTVVLPADAGIPEDAPDGVEGMRENHVYPMVMRASPRGMKIPIERDQQAIVLPLADETQVVTEVVYRDPDPERNKYAAYDLRVPVESEILGPVGRQIVRLTPAEPDRDFYRLSKVRDGPYLVYGDFFFQGRVVKMFHERWGPFHGLVEAEEEGDFGPLSLRTAVPSGSFRGPYLDNGEPRPPLAMIGREGFDAPLGARALLEYRAPERGLAIGRVLGTGELVTPPWRFLLDTEEALLRHKEDPDKDVRVPVKAEFVDGTLRFVSARPDIANFAQHDKWANHEGPYLLPPPYRFEVEAHSGARLPASSAYLSRIGEERKALVGPFSERRSLVAVHPDGEPMGSSGELYDPHPAEVAPFMDGPWVAGEGLERLGWASRLSIKRGGDLLLAIGVLILALTTMIAWAGYGGRAANFVFGRGGDLGFRLVFVLVGLGGAELSVWPILRLADHTMLGLVALNGFGLLMVLLRLRSKDQGEDSSERPAS